MLPFPCGHKRGSRHVLGHPDVRDVPVYIYALTDPDGTVRYVGKSSNPRGRIASHRARSGARPLRAWFASLALRGEVPRLVTLHTVPPGEDAAPWEVHYIREHRKSGRLLNASFSAERALPATGTDGA